MRLWPMAQSENTGSTNWTNEDRETQRFSLIISQTVWSNTIDDVQVRLTKSNLINTSSRHKALKGIPAARVWMLSNLSDKCLPVLVVPFPDFQMALGTRVMRSELELFQLSDLSDANHLMSQVFVYIQQSLFNTRNFPPLFVESAEVCADQKWLCDSRKTAVN